MLIVQPNGVQKEKGNVTKSSIIARQQKIEPKKIKGSVCIMESFRVTTHILLFTLLIFGAKLFSSHLINAFMINLRN